MELAEVALLQQKFFSRNPKKIREKSIKDLEEIQSIGPEQQNFSHKKAKFMDE